MTVKRLCTFNNVLTFKVIADIMKFYKKDLLSQKSKQYSNCMVRFWQEVNVNLPQAVNKVSKGGWDS